MRIAVVSFVRTPISKLYTSAVLRAAAKATGTATAGMSVVVSFLEDQAIRRLNAQYRGLDRVTDVLSFPYRRPGAKSPAQPGEPFGEIAIAAAQMERQARRRGRPVRDELRDLLIHGYLHLLGHDHHQPGERRLMRAWEQAIRTHPSLRRR